VNTDLGQGWGKISTQNMRVEVEFGKIHNPVQASEVTQAGVLISLS